MKNALSAEAKAKAEKIENANQGGNRQKEWLSNS
jgi:hypothetical protein